MALRFDQVTLRQGAFEMRANWVLQPQDRVALLGPSGGGKSTLLNGAAGFVVPAEGRVLWGETDLTAVPPAARPMSILFQDNNLFPHLTLRQNVGLGHNPGLRLDAADWDQVDAALAQVGLADQRDKRPAQISGGQQSRAALARVLLMARPLVLLDEPFAALGPALKAQMLDLVEEVLDQTGAALLMVTHDPKDALRIAQRTIVVADGVAAAPANTGDLLRAPPPALAAYLGDGP